MRQVWRKTVPQGSSRQPGYLVAVVDDDKPLGKQIEGNPKYLVIEVPGRPKREAAKYMQRLEEVVDVEKEPGNPLREFVRVPTNEPKYLMDMTRLPPAIRQKISRGETKLELDGTKVRDGKFEDIIPAIRNRETALFESVDSIKQR